MRSKVKLRMMMDELKKDLVSIIMYTHNNGKYIAESVNSVLAQTYENWELLIIDDSSKDDTLAKSLDFMRDDKRIRVSQYPFERGKREVRNSALRDAKGKYVALLNAGDLWDSRKLEKQLLFMKENNCAFSYTRYREIDEKSNFKGDYGGPNVVTKQDMLKCCWPCYMTVMYDAESLGLFQVHFIKVSNEYALILQVSNKSNCYLLDECLASNRIYKNKRLSIYQRFMWRYEVYRRIIGLNPFSSLSKSLINIYYSVKKKKLYGTRV